MVRYGQLWQRAQEAAAWLAGQGVARGDRVMLVGENCAAMVVSLFACSLAGAWQVGVNARLSAREVASIRQHARPRLTLYTSGVSSAAREHAETAGATPAALPAWGGGVDASLASEPPAAETGELADAVATLIYTSGTTGTPKGVMVPHRGLLHFARISAASRRLTPHDIGYAALPLSHIFGIATVLLATQHAGASLVVRSRFDTEDVYRALRQPGISILQGVPTMFSRLLASAPPRGSARRTCDISIPAAPRWTHAQARRGTLFRTAHASRLRHHRICRLHVHHRHGPPARRLLVRLRGGRRRMAHRQPGPRHAGAWRARHHPDPGPGVMLGYYRDPEQTARALLPGGWLDTGDIGYVDADGALFIAGRSKDLIIRSGFNVYPIEVESVINAFPGVRLSAVVGRQTEDHNEEVVAFVEPLPGAALDTRLLMLHLRAQLAPYKRPAQIIPIDAIPTTVSGKILKQPLKDRLA